MAGNTLNVLLIEDNPGDARLVIETLVQSRNATFVVEHYNLLSTGMARLQVGGIDVLLLDLGLPDSVGIETLVRARAGAPEIPIVVLTGLDDHGIALRATHEGAQDVVFKNHLNRDSLTQSIHCAIQQHRIHQGLRDARKSRDTRELEAIGIATPAASALLDMATFGERRLDEERTRMFAGHFGLILTTLLRHQAGDSGASLSYQLRHLAHELGRVNASARDVLDIYLAAVQNGLARKETIDLHTINERSALAALGLMGHLMSFYQQNPHLPGAGPHPPSLRPS